jgi:hypothetical protein
MRDFGAVSPAAVLNIYLYVDRNPITLTDPTWQFPWCIEAPTTANGRPSCAR